MSTLCGKRRSAAFLPALRSAARMLALERGPGQKKSPAETELRVCVWGDIRGAGAPRGMVLLEVIPWVEIVQSGSRCDEIIVAGRIVAGRAPHAGGGGHKGLLLALRWRLSWRRRNGVALDYRLLAAGKAYNADGLVADVNDAQRPAATVRANEFHPAALPVLERKEKPHWARARRVGLYLRARRDASATGHDHYATAG